MRSIIFSFLFFIVIKSSAQVNIICPKLTDSSLNYFYIGVDNAMEIVGGKIQNIHASISGGGAMMTTTSPGRYIVRVNSETDDCRVSLTGIDGKMILSKTFKVRTIPDPVTTLAGQKDTTLSKNRILLNPFLLVVLPGCYMKNYFSITSFQFTLSKNGDSLSFINTGSRFEAPVIDMIKKAESGSKMDFTEIRGVGPDSRTRKLKPFWIKIEE